MYRKTGLRNVLASKAAPDVKTVFPLSFFDTNSLSRSSDF